MYDIAIVGGGPAGLALALMLAHTNKNIVLVEKEKKLGGCWKSEWVEGKYYSEHSPQVIIENDYKYFMNMIKIIDNNTNQFKYIYTNTLKVLLNFFKNNITFFDFIKILKSFLWIKIFGSNLTIEEWINKSNLSFKTIKAIDVATLIIAGNTTNKVMLEDIFDIIYFNYKPIHPSKKDLWIELLEKELRKFTNITILKETEIFSLETDKNSVTKAITKNKDDIIAKEYILAIPPFALKKIVGNSNKLVQNNWFDYQRFQRWVNQSYYIGIAFQLHFDVKLEVPNIWCWGCMGDWKIILLPVSDYLDKFSYDNTIKTVWSCVIVDTEAYSNNIKKTVNQCSKEEIIKESLFQLSQLYKKEIKPKKTTFYSGIYKKDGKWYSKDSSFSRGKMGLLNQKGNLNNLYAVGAYNIKGIVTMELAIKGAVKFVRENYYGYETIITRENPKLKKLLYFFIFAIITLYFILTIEL